MQRPLLVGLVAQGLNMCCLKSENQSTDTTFYTLTYLVQFPPYSFTNTLFFILMLPQSQFLTCNSHIRPLPIWNVLEGMKLCCQKCIISCLNGTLDIFTQFSQMYPKIFKNNLCCYKSENQSAASTFIFSDDSSIVDTDTCSRK